MNRLAHELSPYLLQHAHNPVDWYPWGEEAFARAKGEDKPVFLSVGYSSCHWCHVMERESFESAEIAAILNEHFVSVKVDREERPDIDSIYMQAVQLMTGRGGWPMSVFLTPEGGPFYAGTYFPPDDRQGMPGFRRVLLSVVDAYSARRTDVLSAADEITRAISGSPEAQTVANLSHDALDRCAAKLADNYDPVYGGFGGAPKFPPSMALDFLMQVDVRQSSPATSDLHEIIVNTLTKMARGGMYDQIGGGFHRYSVDARWLVPHFEKMLYDNALLARLYTQAWRWTRDPFFARIAHEVLGWVTREMTSPEGGFFSSLDADSEGEEGKFYVWSRSEVMGTLGEEDGRVFCALYDITERGNWEGQNIPNVPRDFEAVASDHGLTLDQLADIAARGKCKLYGVRAQRVWPARDDKILAAWNGWMLAAFAEAALAFDRDDYRDVVRRNADLLVSRIDGDGRLTRHAKIGGLLEDYAGVAWALALAFEAVHDRRYLDASRGLADQILKRFSDAETGGFFDTPIDHEKLLTRPKDLFDNATPSGNSLAAGVLLRLAVLFGDERYATEGTRAVEAVFPLAERYPNGLGFLLGVAEWRAGAPREIALTGDPSDERFRALRRVVGETYLPHHVLVAGEKVEDLPLMTHRAADRVMAYVCEAYACQEPTDDPQRLRILLARG